MPALALAELSPRSLPSGADVSLHRRARAAVVDDLGQLARGGAVRGAPLRERAELWQDLVRCVGRRRVADAVRTQVASTDSAVTSIGDAKTKSAQLDQWEETFLTPRTRTAAHEVPLLALDAAPGASAASAVALE